MLSNTGGDMRFASLSRLVVTAQATRWRNLRIDSIDLVFFEVRAFAQNLGDAKQLSSTVSQY